MAKVKWSEQQVLDAFSLAMLEAASMPSPQQMAQELMMQGQQEQMMNQQTPPMQLTGGNPQ